MKGLPKINKMEINLRVDVKGRGMLLVGSEEEISKVFMMGGRQGRRIIKNSGEVVKGWAKEKIEWDEIIFKNRGYVGRA